MRVSWRWHFHPGTIRYSTRLSLVPPVSSLAVRTTLLAVGHDTRATATLRRRHERIVLGGTLEHLREAEVSASGVEPSEDAGTLPAAMTTATITKAAT